MMKIDKRFHKNFITLKSRQRSLEEQIKLKRLNKTKTENVKRVLEDLTYRYNIALYQVQQQINK